MVYSIELPEGRKLKLAELREAANATEDYKFVPTETMEEMKAELADYREQRAKGVRSMGRSHTQDVMSNCKLIRKDVSFLSLLY